MKSAQGETLLSTELCDNGVFGDRGWAVRDEVRGGIRGAKKIGALMKLAARYRAEPTVEVPTPPITITLPDGTTLHSDESDVTAKLSAAIDHAVTLWPLQPASDLAHYRRGPSDGGDPMIELREIFGRTPDEPLPDFSLFPPSVAEFESPPGSYFDVHTLVIQTDRSLRSLAALAPESRVDVRRFRPNIVIRVDDRTQPDDPFPEQAWTGETLRLGDAAIEIIGPCPRCVMITRGFADLPEDRALMRTVVKNLDQNFGVYAKVLMPGRFSVGDAVADANPDH